MEERICWRGGAHLSYFTYDAPFLEPDSFYTGLGVEN